MWFEQGLDSPQSDYADVQDFVVRLAAHDDILVEVGSFVGESTAYLIDQVRASGKRLRLYSVDLFDVEEMCRDGSHAMDQRMNDAGLTPAQWIAQSGPRCMAAEFYRNLRHKDRDQLLTAALIGQSAQMARLFADHSVRFCFIDAGHTYENLTADLGAWWPKMRADGVFAGHDWFSGAEIRRAVMDFGEKHNLVLAVTSSSWMLFPQGSLLLPHIHAAGMQTYTVAPIVDPAVPLPAAMPAPEPESISH